MECDICKVQTEQGDCLLHSVKVDCILYIYTLKQHYVVFLH